MKVLIVSDIHGDYDSFNKVITNESFDKLIVLGDLFSYSYNYSNYEDSSIIKLLQEYKNKLILIKGNCDLFIDYNKFDLNASDIITIPINDHLVTLTHGNNYSRDFIPSNCGDIFISGHTHKPLIVKERDKIFANPGSIGRPRGGSSKCYLIFDNNKLILKDIDKHIIKEYLI